MRQEFTMVPRSVVRLALSALVLSASLAAGLVLAPSEASAQSRSFEEGPVVRRVLLFRSDRFELTPSLGASLNDVYQQGIFVGASGDYHLTNVFSIGLNAMVAPVAVNTPVLGNFEDINPERASRMDTARTFANMDLHVGVVPFSGKLNFAGRRVMHYDVNIFAGFGAAMRASEAEELAGLRAGPVFGAGARLFLRDNLALRLRVQDHMHLSADAQTRRRNQVAIPVEEEMRHHYMLTMGVSFLFPESIRVSR